MFASCGSFAVGFFLKQSHFYAYASGLILADVGSGSAPILPIERINPSTMINAVRLIIRNMGMIANIGSSKSSTNKLCWPHCRWSC